MCLKYTYSFKKAGISSISRLRDTIPFNSSFLKHTVNITQIMTIRNLISFLVFTAVLCSCASTELVRLSVLEPAPVTLPGHIKNIGIINRSGIAEQNKVVDVVDKVFSMEGAELDKEGAESGIAGLENELIKNQRFDRITIIRDSTLKSNVPGIFPAPVSWDVVEKICRKNKSDALFALELFDTDSKISYAANPVTVNTPLGKVLGVEHQASMLTTVKMGWRIYDPVERNILDEFPVVGRMTFSGKGINPVKAAGAIIGRKEALKQVSNKAGQDYALRIIPFWLRVSRDYYVRGTDNFRTARRKAQAGNWDGAAALWQSETANNKSKVAGRACYNMAIISEINGNLGEAMQWAQKAYEDYNNKLALRYVKILENRAAKNALLQEQEAISAR
ncbi:MAG: DUF6340 family protein [Chitinophagaceae bacterium]|nr:DUF6340 family protein [Chitinophagaceae bacterium]